MIRLIKCLFLTLIFCFFPSAVFAFNSIIIGGGAEDGTTCQTDVDVLDSSGSLFYIYGSDTKAGGSFVPTEDGELCEFSMEVTITGSPGDVSLRCGTSLDLSSSYVESTSAVTPETGTMVWEIESGLDMTASTRYYCAGTATGDWSNRVTIDRMWSSSPTERQIDIANGTWVLSETTTYRPAIAFKSNR